MIYRDEIALNVWRDDGISNSFLRFYPVKPIITGECGMSVTNNEEF